jgi:hypothetical protein
MMKPYLMIVAGMLLSANPALADDTQDMHHMDGDMSDMNMVMPGLYGAYPMTREASGTSWQPDDTPMQGIHDMGETWTTMWHGYANLVYDHQGGPRGDTQSFTESMGMFMAQRELGDGTLGLRVMVSLDPTIGKAGYPLLFQTGETADGVTPLVDRQHPHDLFMELAATYSHNLSDDSSIFVYGGLPGEPALGPPAYMHRYSGADNPETPLSHHWLDSTHITFGVVTAGYVWRTLKLEGSVFNGREPDQYRWNIETRKFDSASARLSWNPTPAWSLQISHGRLDSPEALEPDVAVARTTASASYAGSFNNNPWQTTLAWGRNRHSPGDTTQAWLLETNLNLHDKYTLFARAENVENDELFLPGDPLHGQIFAISKLTVGAIYDFARLTHVRLGLGALISGYDYPDALRSSYGEHPTSYMVFLRAKID